MKTLREHKVCAAGVILDAVKDVGIGRPNRWPCLSTTLDGQPCMTTCASRRWPTDAEADAEVAMWEKAIADQERQP